MILVNDELPLKLFKLQPTVKNYKGDFKIVFYFIFYVLNEIAQRNIR